LVTTQLKSFIIFFVRLPLGLSFLW